MIETKVFKKKLKTLVFLRVDSNLKIANKIERDKLICILVQLIKLNYNNINFLE